MTHGITLSKSMYPKTQEERARMSFIPYASTIGSYVCYDIDPMYHMP